MATKKIISSILIFFFLISSVSASLVEEKEKINFEEDTIIYNTLDISLRKIPTLLVKKIDTIESGSR